MLLHVVDLDAQSSCAHVHKRGLIVSSCEAKQHVMVVGVVIVACVHVQMPLASCLPVHAASDTVREHIYTCSDEEAKPNVLYIYIKRFLSACQP